MKEFGTDAAAGYESVINCPKCGKEAVMELERMDNSFFSALKKMFNDPAVPSETSFHAAKVCPSCGAEIIMTVIITAAETGPVTGTLKDTDSGEAAV